MQTAKCFEVYTVDGSLICRVYFAERAIPEERKPDDPAKQPPHGSGRKNGGEADAMTSPQKRMLFRLMVTQGFEGEKAHEELKKRFRVKSLQDVSKVEASHLIEHLIEEKGGNGHGSPV